MSYAVTEISLFDSNLFYTSELKGTWRSKSNLLDLPRAGYVTLPGF